MTGNRGKTQQELLAEAATRGYEASRFRSAAAIVEDRVIAATLRNKAQELEELAAAIETEAGARRSGTRSSLAPTTESSADLRREADNFRRCAEAARRQIALDGRRRKPRDSGSGEPQTGSPLDELAIICDRLADEALAKARKLELHASTQPLTGD
jgi:hypothetical protein